MPSVNSSISSRAKFSFGCAFSLRALSRYLSIAGSRATACGQARASCPAPRAEQLVLLRACRWHRCPSRRSRGEVAVQNRVIFSCSGAGVFTMRVSHQRCSECCRREKRSWPGGGACRPPGRRLHAAAALRSSRAYVPASGRPAGRASRPELREIRSRRRRRSSSARRAAPRRPATRRSRRGAASARRGAGPRGRCRARGRSLRQRAGRAKRWVGSKRGYLSGRGGMITPSGALVSRTAVHNLTAV